MVAVDINATSPFDALPVGVLSGDLVVLELEQVAAADLEPLPLGGSSRSAATPSSPGHR